MDSARREFRPSKEEQAIACAICNREVPVSDSDTTASDDKTRNTYLAPCSHVICWVCYDTLKSGPIRCACKKKIHQNKVIRVYFHEVAGPLSDEIRDLYDRVKTIEKENAELRTSEEKLQARLDELTRMVNEEADKLEKAINDTTAALKAKRVT